MIREASSPGHNTMASRVPGADGIMHMRTHLIPNWLPLFAPTVCHYLLPQTVHHSTYQVPLSARDGLAGTHASASSAVWTTAVHALLVAVTCSIRTGREGSGKEHARAPRPEVPGYAGATSSSRVPTVAVAHADNSGAPDGSKAMPTSRALLTTGARQSVRKPPTTWLTRVITRAHSADSHVHGSHAQKPCTTGAGQCTATIA
jgi:hypothetical protein